MNKIRSDTPIGPLPENNSYWIYVTEWFTLLYLMENDILTQVDTVCN